MRLCYDEDSNYFMKHLHAIAEQPEDYAYGQGWDSVTARIILGYTKKITYECIENEDLPNRIVFHIR